MQAVALPMLDMVVPAPRAKRPFEELSQPFPSFCSKLCNHPIDPERAAPTFTLAGDQWQGEENKAPTPIAKQCSPYFLCIDYLLFYTLFWLRM